MKIFCSPVPQSDVGKVWHLCKPLLKKATDREGSRQNVEGLYGSVKSGSSCLWCIFIDDVVVGSATTEVNSYTEGKILRVSFLGGGRMELWLEKFIESLKEYGRFNGCNGIDLVGRKGWLRKLENFGFKQEPFVCMALAL